MTNMLIIIGTILVYGISAFVSFGFFYAGFNYPEFNNKKTCIMLGMLYGIMGPIGILLSFFASEGHGWLIKNESKGYRYKWKLKSETRYIQKKIKKSEDKFKNLLKKCNFESSLYLSIFAFLDLLEIKDKDIFIDRIAKSILLNIEVTTFSIQVDKYLLSTDCSVRIGPNCVNTKLLVDSNLRIPRYFDIDYCLSNNFSNFEVLDKICDMIKIKKSKRNIKYLEDKNYEFILYDHFILVRDARSLTLPGRVKSRKL